MSDRAQVQRTRFRVVRQLCLALAAFLVVALHCAASLAQSDAATDASRAIEKANAGERLFKQGKWRDALAQFRQADGLYHSPVFVLFAARSLRKSGRLLEARTEYEKLVRETLEPEAPVAWAQAQTQGRAELDKLLGEIPSVIVKVLGADERASVLVNGRKLLPGMELELDPGLHRFEVRSKTGTIRKLVTLTRGEKSKPVQLGVGKRATGEKLEPPREPNWPGWIVTGVGGAALITGGVFGVLAQRDASDAEADLPHTCVGNTCPQARRDEIEESMDPARRKATVANAFFIGGGVVAAAGLVMLILDPLDSTSPSARASQGQAKLQLQF